MTGNVRVWAKGMRAAMVRTCTNRPSPVQLEIKLLPDDVQIDLHTKLTRFSLPLIAKVRVCDILFLFNTHIFKSSKCMWCRTYVARALDPWCCSENLFVTRGSRGSSMSRCRTEHVYARVNSLEDGQHSTPFIGA